MVRDLDISLKPLGLIRSQYPAFTAHVEKIFYEKYHVHKSVLLKSGCLTEHIKCECEIMTIAFDSICALS